MPSPAAARMIQARLLPWLQRGLLLLGQLAILLPFATVQGCGATTSATHTGWEMYRESASLTGVMVVQLVVAGLLFARPWRPGGDPAHRTTGLGLRAAAAGAMAFVTGMAPALAWLFDTVRPRVGWILHSGSWVLFGLGCFFGASRAALALRGEGPLALPEKVGVAVALGTPVGAAVLLGLRSGRDAVSGGALGLLRGLPLALACLGVGRLVQDKAPDATRWRAGLWTCLGLWVAGWVASLR